MEKVLTAQQFLSLWRYSFGVIEGWTVVRHSNWEIHYKDYRSKETVYYNGQQAFMVVEGKSIGNDPRTFFEDLTCHELETVTYEIKK